MRQYVIFYRTAPQITVFSDSVVRLNNFGFLSGASNVMRTNTISTIFCEYIKSNELSTAVIAACVGLAVNYTGGVRVSFP